MIAVVMVAECAMILILDVVGGVPGVRRTPALHFQDTSEVFLFLWSIGEMIAAMDRVNKMVSEISDQVRCYSFSRFHL